MKFRTSNVFALGSIVALAVLVVSFQNCAKQEFTSAPKSLSSSGDSNPGGTGGTGGTGTGGSGSVGGTGGTGGTPGGGTPTTSPRINLYDNGSVWPANYNGQFQLQSPVAKNITFKWKPVNAPAGTAAPGNGYIWGIAGVHFPNNVDWQNAAFNAGGSMTFPINIQNTNTDSSLKIRVYVIMNFCAVEGVSDPNCGAWFP